MKMYIDPHWQLPVFNVNVSDQQKKNVFFSFPGSIVYDFLYVHTSYMFNMLLKSVGCTVTKENKHAAEIVETTKMTVSPDDLPKTLF